MAWTPQSQVEQPNYFSSPSSGEYGSLGGGYSSLGGGYGSLGGGINGTQNAMARPLGSESQMTMPGLGETGQVGAESGLPMSAGLSSSAPTTMALQLSQAGAGQLSPITSNISSPVPSQIGSSAQMSTSPTLPVSGGGVEGVGTLPTQVPTRTGGLPTGATTTSTSAGLTGPTQSVSGWGQASSTQTAQGSTSGWGQASTSQNSQSSTSSSSSSLKQDLQQLQSDMQTIYDKSQVTPALLSAVRNDIQGLQKESTSAPSQSSLSTLETDLEALNGATTDFTQGTLNTDLTAVLTSAGVNDATLEATLASDLNAVATAMNVTSTDVSTIESDVKAVTSDAGSSASSQTPTNPLASYAEHQLLGSLTASTQSQPLVGRGIGGLGGPVAFNSVVGQTQQGTLSAPGQTNLLSTGPIGSASGSTTGMPFQGNPFGGPMGI